MTNCKVKTLPEYFTVSYDSYNYLFGSGFRHWEVNFTRIDEQDREFETDQWTMTHYMDGERKTYEFVTEDVAQRYFTWGVNKTPKTGMDYRNIKLHIWSEPQEWE
jgi:hypothetical protein